MLHYKFQIDTISKYRTELMGLAILGVMLGHLMNETYQPLILAQLARVVHTPGFLFLSGFGLYYSFSNNSDVYLFFKKRIVRLYIPYFMITLPFFFALLALGRCSFLQFFGYMTTAAFWYEGNYYAMWYVAVSLTLYAIFPLMYHAFFNKYDRPFLFCGVFYFLMISLMSFIQFLFPNYWEIVKFGLSRSYLFPIGCVCGYLSKKKVGIPWYYLLIYILICGVFFSIRINTPVTRTMMGIPLVCIFLDYLFNKNKNVKIKKFLSWFGKYSLELYLLHMLIFFVLRIFYDLNNVVSISLGIVCGILLCHPVSLLVKRIAHPTEANRKPTHT